MNLVILIFFTGYLRCGLGLVNARSPEENRSIAEPDFELAEQILEELQISGPNADEVGSFTEGDIILPRGFERHIRAVTNQDYRKWNRGIIPYSVDSYYSFSQQRIILSAMEEIQRKTCINFVERTTEADYIRIVPGEGCSSYVGRRGGQQAVTLDPHRCLGEVGVVAHELLHVLGFYHEHTRLDRDDFIDILWNNMESGREVNFHKRSPGTIDTLGKPYDYNSVMHYSAYAFSLDERRPTLIPRDRSSNINLKTLGQRRELSPLDVEKVNAYYNCDNRGVPSDRARDDQVGYLSYAMPDDALYATTTTTTTTTTPPPVTTTFRSLPRHVAFKAGAASRRGSQTQPPNPCHHGFRTNAMLTTTDGSMHLFHSKYFWVVDPHRYLSKALLIRDYYLGLPDDIDAAFTWLNGQTYFFKGQYYWKYHNFQPMDGYPQDIKHGFPGLPGSIDAALLWSEGRIVFIKDDAYWVLHPTYFNQVRGPFPLRPDFGFPSYIHAGFGWPSISSSSSSSLTTPADADAVGIWILADQHLYPIDTSAFKVSAEKQPLKLMEWLRCDLYDQISDGNHFWR